MNRKWSIRVYQDGDEEGIYQLYNAVYPAYQTDRESWLRHWHWLYSENPAGNGLIWIAEAGSRIISQHGLIPTRFKVDNQIVLGSWGVDIMTHPDYRRQGIFEMITREITADGIRRGVELTTGIPNRYSRRGLTKKSERYDVSRMTVMLKPHNWKSAIRFKVGNLALSNMLAAGGVVSETLFIKTRRQPAPSIKVTPIASFDERFDLLWPKIAGQYKIMAVRDRNYLNWRYNVPNKKYTILSATAADEALGYLVYGNKNVKDTKISNIFTLVGVSGEVKRCLVSAALESSRQAGIDFMMYSFIADGESRRVLRKCGFITFPLIKGSNFTVHSGSQRFDKAFLLNPANWFYETGDTDTF